MTVRIQWKKGYNKEGDVETVDKHGKEGLFSLAY